jgi:tRNA A-37 threonylcarbamoyl transferase component Bud32
VLATHEVHFKVLESGSSLRSMNSGDAGRAQVGKFIVAYPRDDEQAVRLASDLDAATSGLSGPRVPTDRPIRSGSLVHYRYGAFDDSVMQLPTGETVGAILSPTGGLEPDLRTADYTCPDWVQDPFLCHLGKNTAGHDELRSTTHEALSSLEPRFVSLRRLSLRHHSSAFLAIDLTALRTCVVKHRTHSKGEAEAGMAILRSATEAEVLSRLAGRRGVPIVYDFLSTDDASTLVIEDIDGVTLDDYVQRHFSYGRALSEKSARHIGARLARILDDVHAAGFIYRDLSSRNVLVGAGEEVYLVDFELAHPLLSSLPVTGRGTPGYMSRQQASGASPVVADDIYGLGAILFLLATGVEPFAAPDTRALLSRDPRTLNPALSPGTAAIVERCLAHRRSRRYETALRVARALEVQGDAADPRTRRSTGRVAESARRAHARSLARALGDALCHEAVRVPDGVAWTSRQPNVLPIRHRHINVGGAGAVLALAELWAELRDARHRDALVAGARWLAATRPAQGPSVPGLYSGEAGVGAALLRAGQVLGDSSLIEAASTMSHGLATEHSASPDVFTGNAGRLRFHLLVWRETGDAAHLQHAIHAGDDLLAAASGSAAASWTLPGHLGDLSNKALPGYAHGAAGIGDCLLDLYTATRAPRFAGAARRAGEGISDLAWSCTSDDPAADRGVPSGLSASWCHGAAGIGRFMLRLAQHRVWQAAGPIADNAALIVARDARRQGPTQCHGLAGSIEFLLDVYQAREEKPILRAARDLEIVMDAFRRQRDGRVSWRGDSRASSPDYLLGYAGIAVCLLRLAEPERLPHQLSLAGFAS